MLHPNAVLELKHFINALRRCLDLDPLYKEVGGKLPNKEHYPNPVINDGNRQIYARELSDYYARMRYTSRVPSDINDMRKRAPNKYHGSLFNK